MALPLFLDSNILGRIVQPTVAENAPVVAAITRLFDDVRFRIYLPEIVDYELRRKLLHLAHRPHQARKWAQEALKILDQVALTNYAPIMFEPKAWPQAAWFRR
jgi:predicted nucleic acid-binding protein